MEKVLYTTSDWFLGQQGNSETDSLLNGFLPTAGSPLTLGGTTIGNAFFDDVDYVGAFKDANDD